jgi:DNA (cytosine-5)-methyltransferase 1
VRDPRNKLFRKYVSFVDAVKPQMIMLENVPGMKTVHGESNAKGKSRRGRKRKSYYDKLIEALDLIGYAAEGRMLNATSFGAPQGRSRLVVIGLRKELLSKLDEGFDEIFEDIAACAQEQMRQIGLKAPVTAKDALSDLELASGKLIPYTYPDSHKGFQMLQYSKPTTIYQRLMNGGIEPEKMDSMRLARHTDTVAKRFSLILDECERGVNVSETHRKRFHMLKHRTLPMSPSKPAPTLTTLPDDVLHYSEPRILTVREYARIQSFPDWFHFKGKYTTGGDRRKKDCPRYTQIGNAVPPLLAQGIGHALQGILEKLAKPRTQRGSADLQTAGREVAYPTKHYEPATF